MKKCTQKWMHVLVCSGSAAAMIFAGCSGQKRLSDRFVEETVTKSAEEIIELVLEGDYEKITEEYESAKLVTVLKEIIELVHEGDYEKIIEEYESAKLVTVLTEEDLRNAVQPVMEELGEPEKIEKTVVRGTENPETKEKYATAVSIVSYENGKAQYTITFNQTMKMEGFYIK